MLKMPGARMMDLILKGANSADSDPPFLVLGQYIQAWVRWGLEMIGVVMPSSANLLAA